MNIPHPEWHRNYSICWFSFLHPVFSWEHIEQKIRIAFWCTSIFIKKIHKMINESSSVLHLADILQLKLIPELKLHPLSLIARYLLKSFFFFIFVSKNQKHSHHIRYSIEGHHLTKALCGWFITFIELQLLCVSKKLIYLYSQNHKQAQLWQWTELHVPIYLNQKGVFLCWSL